MTPNAGSSAENRARPLDGLCEFLSFGLRGQGHDQYVLRGRGRGARCVVNAVTEDAEAGWWKRVEEDLRVTMDSKAPFASGSRL